MIGHRTKNTNNEYLRYYQCGNFHAKGSAICNSNLVWADHYVEEQLSKVEKNIAKYLTFIEKSDNPPTSIIDKIASSEEEKKHLIGHKSELKLELEKPTIKEVSFEQVYTILKGFSKFLRKVEPLRTLSCSSSFN